MAATGAVDAGRVLGDGRIRMVGVERIGGVAAILIALGYIAMMPLFGVVGAPPEGALARLEYHATGAAAWWGIVALSVLTDLLFVPLAIALHAALGRLSGPAMLVAGAFIGMFVVLDLAVLWPAKVALISLGQAFGPATGAERATILAAAGYPSAVLDSALVAVYSVLTLGIGLLATGAVMLWGGLGRVTAAVGIATGLVAIASVVETLVTDAFPVLVVAASLLTIVWLVLVGRSLFGGHCAGTPGRPSGR